MSSPSRPDILGASLRSPASAAAAAAVLVALALGVSDGNYDPSALGLVTLAALLCAVALFASLPGAVTPSADRGAAWVVGAGLVASLAFDALYLPGMTVDPARLGAFRPVLAVVAALATTYLWRSPPRWLVLLRFPAILLCWIVLAGIVLWSAPSPGIDVWTMQQSGALALSRGLNPYALAYRNPYPPDAGFLSRELLSPDARFITAFPYPPLALLAGLPGVLLGDVRIAYVAATAVAAWVVRALGARTRVAELAAILLLLQPRTLLVMEASWTEPLVLLTTAGVAFLVLRARTGREAAGRPRWPLLGIAGGLALSSKQYALLLLLPLWFAVPPRHRWRATAVAAAVAAAIHLPFLAWDPGALWRGLVTFQIVQPFREDALSWPAAVVQAGGPRLPAWIAFVASGVVCILAVRRVARVWEALVAAALSWLVLVVWNKQAFCNYYWLAVGLLCAAVAAIGPERGDEAAEPERTRG